MLGMVKKVQLVYKGPVFQDGKAICHWCKQQIEPCWGPTAQQPVRIQPYFIGIGKSKKNYYTHSNCFDQLVDSWRAEEAAKATAAEQKFVG